jgi:hypothetical protein
MKEIDINYDGDLSRKIAAQTTDLRMNEESEADDDSHKYNRDSKFQLKKMAILVKRYTPLLQAYLKLYKKYKGALGYHYNEIMLAWLFVQYILTNEKLYNEYMSIVVMPKDKGVIYKDGKFVESEIPANKELLLDEEEDLSETTTSASSGAYVGKATFNKGKKMNKGKAPFTHTVKSVHSVRQNDSMYENKQKQKMNFQFDKHPLDILAEEGKISAAANAAYNNARKENKKNFDKDFKNSNTKKVISKEKEYYDPYKYDKDAYDEKEIKKFGNNTSYYDEVEKSNVDFRRGMESLIYDLGDKYDELEKQYKKSMTDKEAKDMIKKIKKKEADYKQYRSSTNTRNMLTGADKKAADKKESTEVSKKLISEALTITGTYKDKNDISNPFTKEITFQTKGVEIVENINNMFKIQTRISSDHNNNITNNYDFYLSESGTIVAKPLTEIVIDKDLQRLFKM